MHKWPVEVDYSKKKQYRIIPSVYPTINFFENLVDPSEMEIVFEIESLTNDRLRQEVGDIFLVPPEDRVCGPGASVVMAAFTHVTTNSPSRFTDGTYGVYYASLTQKTAIYETVFHRERFLRTTNEAPGEITMRVYEGEIKKRLFDVRSEEYKLFHHESYYAQSQAFGKALRATKAWGLIYNSVRHPGGECIAALRPPAISNPHQTKHLRYRWNGETITEVLDMQSLLQFS